LPSREEGTEENLQGRRMTRDAKASNRESWERGQPDSQTEGRREKRERDDKRELSTTRYPAASRPPFGPASEGREGDKRMQTPDGMHSAIVAEKSLKGMSHNGAAPLCG